ncbi:hypothetical protein GCM10027294_02960 [Marinactinospora endophytica]
MAGWGSCDVLHSERNTARTISPTDTPDDASAPPLSAGCASDVVNPPVGSVTYRSVTTNVA